MHIRIALPHVHPCTKFGVPRSKGVRARGQKAENNKIAPWGHNFDPSGLILPMTRNSDQGASDLKVWAPGHFPLGQQPWHNIFRRVHAAARGTWRHVTATIVVPSFRRIEWAVSRPDRPSRSGAIHETRISAGHFHAAILQRVVHIFATRCQPLRCLEANTT